MLKLIHLLRPLAPYILAVWVIIIITVSSLPGIPELKLHTTKSDIRLDYLIHFCEYGSLAFLAYLTFSKEEYRTGAKRFFWITAGVVAFSVADEFHQKFIPGRTFNIKDLASNLSGILAALVFCVYMFRRISGVDAQGGERRAEGSNE